MVRIFTDGACSGNPGIGGWGVVIIIDKKEPIFLNGGENIQLTIVWSYGSNNQYYFLTKNN